MKCPFCQQTIVCTNTQDADEYATWFCPHCVAERNWRVFGNKELWQELIRTRKALDVAVDRLEKMTWGCDSSDAEHLLKEIKEITEQKDEK